MHEPVTQSPVPLDFVGEDVRLSTVGDFRIGHGQFRLRNRGDASLRVAFEQVWFAVDGQRQPQTLVGVFDIARGENLDPSAVMLEPGEAISVYVGFPPFVHQGAWGEQASVVVQVRVGDVTLEATSLLHLQRRIPRG